MEFYRVAANATLTADVAYIAFVGFGLIVTWLGISLNWQWIRNGGFVAFTSR